MAEALFRDGPAMLWHGHLPSGTALGEAELARVVGAIRDTGRG